MKDNYKEVVPQAELEASADVRRKLLQKWGFEPTSFWVFNKFHKKEYDVLGEDTLAEGSYERCNYNVRDGALSQFPLLVAERICKFYTEPGDVVLNPFMGRAAHLLVMNYLGRHVIGQDLSRNFYDHVVAKVKKRILQSNFIDAENNKIVEETPDKFISLLNGLRFETFYGDSRKLFLSDESVDLIFNSPPYFCLEQYGDEVNQLGTGTWCGRKPSYEEFLSGLKDVYKECFRVLKPNKFFLVLLNDFRLNGKYYPYHMDATKISQEVGFTLWDNIIYNLSVHPLAAIFTSQIEERKMMAKQHETLLVFKKVVE